MVVLAQGLTDRDRDAIAALEQRVLAVDGGRLKLEWRVLRSRSGDQVEDVLWWEREQDRLLGFLGLYAFSPPTVEIVGMVDPAARRRGMGTALLDAALPICLERGFDRVLLVTPRGSAAGRAFALGRGAVLEHSEHALVLRDAPADGPADPRIVVRRATPADVPELARILSAAFGGPAGDVAAEVANGSEPVLLAEREGAPVGTVRLTPDGQSARIYGFAVDPPHQGAGIGRDVLRRVCRQLREAGAQQIGLEVAVDNDRALGLYTSLGFTLATTEDYYELSSRPR